MNNLLLKFVFLILSLILNVFNISGQGCDSISIDISRRIINDESVSKQEVLAAYLQLTRCFLSTDLDSAGYYADEGITLANSEDNERFTAAFLVQIGDIAYSSGDQEKALSALEDALETYDGIEKDQDFLKAINIVGLIHEIRQDYENAMKFYLNGLNEAKLQNDTLVTAFFYNNSSLIYKIIGDTAKAIKHIKEAMHLFKAINNQYFYSNALVNIGNFYKGAGAHEEAEKFLLMAEQLQIEMKNHYGLFNNYGNLGDIALIKKDTNLAIEYYNKSIQEYQFCDTLDPLLQYELAYLLEDFANIYYLKAQYNDAIRVLRRIVREGENQNSLAILSLAYKGLSDSHHQLGNVDSSLYYLLLYQPVQDSLIKERYNEKIDKINYDHQLKEERAILESEKELLILEQQRRELVFLILGIILLTVSVISILVWLLQRNKLRLFKLKSKALRLEAENLQNEVDAKNRKLTTSALNLIERNEFIAGVAEKLKVMEHQGENTDSDSIYRLIREIDHGNSNKLWDEFEKRYMEVHSDFHKRLTSRYPNLTSNDRKLCAFILLDMSTKDISSITYQRPQSIKVARYRLRKKLGLDKNENLSAFLHNL